MLTWRVNELRNIVFHFSSGHHAERHGRLRRFRDRLRYDRELYNNKSVPTSTLELAK